MKAISHVMAISIVAFAISAGAPLQAQTSIAGARGVEPQAGKWKTWIIPSGQSYRVPPPPDAAATRGELQWLKRTTAELDATALEQVRHWDAGAPVYRWMDMIERRVTAGESLTAHPHRVFAYVAMAMYDATVAAWDSKYAYNRPRPSEVDPTIRPLVAVPDSPSYPSEHAAAAGAAAGVLSWFFPDQASVYQSIAEEAGRSRLFAGVQYPSDYSAGLELGRQVAQKVIERVSNDGYTLTWSGAVPTGRCMWTGSNPGNAAALSWKPFLLTSPGEFRPAPPPDCQSPQMKEEVARIKDFQRTFNTNQIAYFWQGPEGRETRPFILAEKWMFEDKLERNPPRAARVYALLAAAHYDTFIASQDGKFAYWYLRPHQLEPGITPLFAVPNFPSYPSNHSTFSWSRAAMLSYLFPAHTEEANAMARDAAESRIWAGIHYPVDLEAGLTLGRSVAGKFIEWAQNDGSR
jgi:membrane-associated phospholipid phosphatase